MASKPATFVGFEPYKLTGIKICERVYGHGSYATVIELDYMGLKCAGKKIHELLLMQGNSTYTVRRFEEECHILSRVRHPNIVQFLGVHFQPGVQAPILVMEFLPFNLSNCIEQYGILPDEISYSILHNVASGLCYLHSQIPPIIHRDLSSNNVLLTRDMTAKISDLGMARILDLPYHQFSRMTQTPGTPAFMPPEVMIAKPKYDTSVDTFSFGVMMVHVFSGKWPEPQIGPTRTERGKLIPVSEAERREEFLQIIGNEHLLMKMIHRCIHNDPTMRVCMNDLIRYLADLVKKFPASFANQLDILKRIKSNEEENQRLKEEFKQREQETLAQELELSNEIERLKQQNDELIKQNQMLSSEKENLMEQVTRDEEVMLSTIELLKHTVEQKCYFSSENRVDVEGEDSIQQPQLSQAPSSNQTIHKSESTPVDSATSVQSTSITLKQPEIEKQTSSWLTKKVNKVLGIPKSQPSLQHPTSKKTMESTVIDQKEDLNKWHYCGNGQQHDNWEVRHSSVQIIKKIGGGFFCETYEGIWNGTIKTAVRTPNLIQFSVTNFMDEAAIMKQLSHPNILKLYATCLSKKPFYLLTEFMQHGTLFEYLHYESQTWWTKFPKVVLDVSTQVVNGMAYMEQQRCIHRNLSLQTILVGEKLVCKVANFSCARRLEPGQDIVIAPSTEAFKPSIRWSSPESILHRRFSSKSDVWSFGILLYEIASGGQIPYPEMTDNEILREIERDARGLQRYYHSVNPSDINDIIRRCMEVEPANRPSFKILMEKHLKNKKHKPLL